MTGFTGRTHTSETKARIGAASCGRAASNLGRKASPETRAKQRAAKLGGKHSEEHNRRIGEGLRRWSETAEPWQKRRGWRKYLSDQESADLNVLRRAGLSRAEALQSINRGDLAELVLASIKRASLAELRPSVSGQTESAPRKS